VSTQQTGLPITNSLDVGRSMLDVGCWMFPLSSPITMGFRLSFAPLPLGVFALISCYNNTHEN
jgi:hypothetical protein